MKRFLGAAQYIGDRPEQQDAFRSSDPSDERFVRHGGFLGVVADGVGGGKYGQEAAVTAVNSFLSAYLTKAQGESIGFALERSLKQANEEVLKFGRRVGEEGTCGATLVAGVIHNGSLHWISAGDSRAYLSRAGRLYRLTYDHNVGSLLKEEVAAGTIDSTEADQHPDRENLTSYVGKPEPPNSDGNTEPFPLTPNDRVLLCTDGLYRTLSEDQMASMVVNDPQSSCVRLIREVQQRRVPGQDNTTVMVMMPKRNTIDTTRILRILLVATGIINFLLFILLLNKIADGLGSRLHVRLTSVGSTHFCHASGLEFRTSNCLEQRHVFESDDLLPGV
jgi:protein phosphatase